MSRKKDSKEKKEKKKKSKIRKFFKWFFIVLLIIILAYAGWFGYNYSRHVKVAENTEYDPLSATALGLDPEKLKNIGRINVLILGESGVGDGYKLTDTIILASYNPQTQQASMLSIPRDTYVGKQNKNTATQHYIASYKMNAMYRNGENIEETVERVSEITGIDINNYVLVDTEGIVEIVDAIGGVKFNVPIDMNYDDTNQNLHIHLQAGEQIIDGAKAEQLLRFRHNQDGSSYSEEYGDNDLGRMRTQREFIQTTLKQLIRFENVTKVLNLLDITFKNVKSDLTVETIKYYIPYIFKFNMDNIKTDMLPGKSELCNGIWIYDIDKKKTEQVIDELFTDIIPEEEDPLENVNIIDGTEVVDSDVVSKEIKVELLNGTSSETKLNEVEEILKNSGYKVVKTGTTTATSNSVIIKRTMQSQSIENKLKNLLKINTVNTSLNNSNVDFTIIIGKDYK